MPSIAQALQEYSSMNPTADVGPSVLDKIVTQGVQENQLRQSAISDANRARWGFADDFGKQKILMESGYRPEDVVRLKNGDWGIQTEYGIKPVDPKGFQLSDLRGDMTESMGKAITTVGGILGATAAGVSSFGAGSVAGAAAGSAGGEAIRQAIGASMGVREPKNLAKIAFQDDAGWHLGGAGEILAEGLGGAAGQKLGNMLGNKLAQAGSIKAATNVADNVMSSGEIKPSVLDAVAEMVNLPKGTNKTLLKEFLDPNGAISKVSHPMSSFETLQRAGNKAVNIVEKGKGLIDDIYAKGLKEAGIDTNIVKVPISKGITELDKSIADIMSSPLQKQATPIVRQLQDLKTWIGKNAVNGELSLNQIKEVTTALNNIKSQTFASGMAGKFTSKANRPLAAFTAAKNSNPVIANLNAQYKPQIQALKKLQTIMNIKLEEGLAKEGRFTPEMFISRLSNELKDRNLQAIIKADDVLSKSPEFKNLSIKQDLLTALLTDKMAAAQNKSSAASLLKKVPVLGEAAAESINPIRKLGMIKGLINIGVFNPKAMDMEVSKITPKLSALFNLTAAGNVVPNVGKVVNSIPGKEVGKTMLRQLLQSQSGTSLNQTLYGGQ